MFFGQFLNKNTFQNRFSVTNGHDSSFPNTLPPPHLQPFKKPEELPAPLIRMERNCDCSPILRVDNSGLTLWPWKWTFKQYHII